MSRLRSRTAAVATVCRRDLEQIESALAPGASAERRALAREAVRYLCDVAHWRQVGLPTLRPLTASERPVRIPKTKNGAGPKTDAAEDLKPELWRLEKDGA